MDTLVYLDTVSIARATAEHVPVIERLLADDPTSPQHVATTTLVGDSVLGEGPDDADLTAAFEVIDADPNQLLAVIMDDTGHVIGTFQVSLLTSLARGGGSRAIITGARIRSGPDAVDVAKQILAWITEYAASRGARAVVVSTERDRAHIQSFYTTLGFRHTHDGLSLPL